MLAAGLYNISLGQKERALRSGFQQDAGISLTSAGPEEAGVSAQDSSALPFCFTAQGNEDGIAGPPARQASSEQTDPRPETKAVNSPELLADRAVLVLERMPEGAEALIGENGRNISGGEAQRLGLARCLAHGAQFMVFDEVAASLDNRNAEEIEKTILSLPEAGVLMITHRVFAENMRRYDRIFVLKDGALVEQGTWEELTSQRGELYRLSLQAGNNEP